MVLIESNKKEAEDLDLNTTTCCAGCVLLSISIEYRRCAIVLTSDHNIIARLPST